MRVRDIIIESFKIPFEDYKSFIRVFLMMFSCEFISELSRMVKMGDYYIFIIIIRSIITLILIGISMNVIQTVIFDKSLHLNFKEHLFEGIKEYVLTLYYLLIPAILSLFFIKPTGLYSNIIAVENYIVQMDIDKASLSVMELSHQLPHSMNFSFTHSLQMQVLITMFLFVLFTSFSYIARILLFKYDDIKMAIDLRNILKVVNNIGYLHFMKFVFLFTLILVFVVNFLVNLKSIFTDLCLSTLFDVFLLFFATNAFYKLYFDSNTQEFVNDDEK